MPEQQVLGGPHSGGVEEGTDAEPGLSAQLVVALLCHHCQVATVAPGLVGWVD
ncbi:MAG: hypothetical protein ACRDSR_11835 [Pseudonocardiaceae bacterium]